MKKLIPLLALSGSAFCSFAQGYVAFSNDNTSRIYTNGPATQGLAGGPVGSWYYALLVAPTTQTTIDASLSGWTFVAYGTNTATSGRMSGGNTNDTYGELIAQVPGYAPGTSANFAVVGCSGNFGSGWNWTNLYYGRPTTLVSGVGNYAEATWGPDITLATLPGDYGYPGGVTLLPFLGAAMPWPGNGVTVAYGYAYEELGAWYGISAVATVMLSYYGGPYNFVLGPASVGLIPGFSMNFYEVGAYNIPPPTLAVVPSAPGQFVFKVTGDPNVPCALQISTDLRLWTPVSTNFLSSTHTNNLPFAVRYFTNSLSPAPAHQFWRALWQQ